MAGLPGSPVRCRLIGVALAAALAGLPVLAAAQSSAQEAPPAGAAPGDPQPGDSQPGDLRSGGARPGGTPARGGPRRGVLEGSFAVVSRERILREAAAARRLREAEEALTARLQGQIDETKAAFAAEEAELARLRGELPDQEFESRVAAFDQRVRLARRNAQERAAVLQKTFQDVRAAIVAALPALMERLRVEAGASIVLNADDVLALDPAYDLTDRAIELFDAEGPSAEPPPIDLSAPLSQPPPGGAPALPGSGAAAPAAEQPPSR